MDQDQGKTLCFVKCLHRSVNRSALCCCWSKQKWVMKDSPSGGRWTDVALIFVWYKTCCAAVRRCNDVHKMCNVTLSFGANLDVVTTGFQHLHQKCYTCLSLRYFRSVSERRGNWCDPKWRTAAVDRLLLCPLQLKMLFISLWTSA